MKKNSCVLFILSCLPLLSLAQENLKPFSKQYETPEASIAIFSTYITQSVIDSTSPKTKASGDRVYYCDVTGGHLWFNLYPKDPKDSIKLLSQKRPIDILSNIDINYKTAEFRVILNGKTEKDWSNISAGREISDEAIRNSDKKITSRSGFELLSEQININDSIVIEIRRKDDKKLQATFSIKRTRRKYLPFLAMMCHDTSSTKHIPQLFIKYLIKKDSIYERINTFYKDWAPDDNGMPFPNATTYYASSKIMFIFRKYEDNTPDSSMEYQLTPANKESNYWKITGHMLIIDNLQSNASYNLRVRYRSHPENTYTILLHTAPKWYQTMAFVYQMILSGIFIVGMVAFIIYQQHAKNVQSNRQRLSLEIKSIRAQLNPHFVFNALSSIQSLVNKKETDRVNLYLSEFSSLMRDTLKSSDSEFAPLVIEIRMTETYLKLEQLRSNFSYSINIADGINSNAVEVPSLLLQPLIENAVRHGIANLADTGKVHIEITAKYSDLVVTITDNGHGFDPSNKHEGYGLKLTRDRINLLNQTVKKQPIKMHIESNKDSGTTVHLVFENWLDT